MPALNQDFLIYDLDQFQVRFNVTDAAETLINGDQRLWWGVADSSTDGSGPQNSYLKIERSNAAWTNSTGTSVDVNFGSTALVNIQPTYVDILVRLAPPASSLGKGGSKSLQPSNASYPAFYYHECIFASDGNQNNSNGIATGQITVNKSMFTQEGYRV